MATSPASLVPTFNSLEFEGIKGKVSLNHAPIAPYAKTRQAVRQMIDCWGGFLEIHVASPIEVCEGRDRKGLYAKARAGLIPECTGVSDPYEIPEQPELAIDTSRYSVDVAVQSVILKLEHEGYLC